MTSAIPHTRRSARQPVGGLAAAALAVASWYAWLGWDHAYQTDPTTGAITGPYEAWQVIGCAASILLLLLAAVRSGVHPLVVAAATTVAFTAAWSADAATSDDSGLWAVGAVLLFLALSTGTTTISFIVYALTRRPRPHHGDAGRTTAA